MGVPPENPRLNSPRIESHLLMYYLMLLPIASRCVAGLAIIFLSASLGSVVHADETTASTLDEACAKFSAFDQNDDGIVEIASLKALYTAGEDANAGTTAKRVLLLVEPRLLEPLEGAADLRPLLTRWADDLAAEGYRSAIIAAQLGDSDLHQDGRYLLALREFLRSVHGDDQSLAGVVLVGRFPDALIVRTCNWRKKGNITLHKGKPEQQAYENARFLRRVPENVADRADIVLSDLDGNWEDIYVQPQTKVPTTLAVFADGIPPHGGPATDVQIGSRAFVDFFHVSDGKLEVSEWTSSDGETSGKYVTLFDASGDHEASDADRARSNIIARPDIMVSRLDARGVALKPKTSIVGADGEGLLDENGQPQAVAFADKRDMPSWKSVWQADPILERRLLAEYLDRNHNFRTGQTEIAWRPSSIACDLGSGFSVMRRAADDWISTDRKAADLRGRPSLNDFAEWMQYPAVLRTVRAHSDAWGSVFARPDVNKLDEQLHGPAWSWTPRGNQLVPSLSAACRGGKLDWYLLRSLWENGQLASEPAFYHHTGCNGISPPGGATRPYNHASYGNRQGGESLLLYGNGLALVGRAKVFYDEPKGFAATLAAGETFGRAWAAYYEIESNAESWSKAGGDIGRKRSYFWSVLGDWTLRLEMAKPEK